MHRNSQAYGGPGKKTVNPKVKGGILRPGIPAESVHKLSGPPSFWADQSLTTLKDQAGLRGHSADAILLHFKASGDKKVTAKKYRAYVMDRIRAHPAEWA